jgi:hypothetical protein
VQGSELTFTLDSKFIDDGDYAFRIEDIESGEVNYSDEFSIESPSNSGESTSSSSEQSVRTTAPLETSISASTIDQISSSTPGATTDATKITSDPRETESTTAQSSSDGLSIGEKAGIGVGAAVGGILILVAVGWFLSKRVRAKTTSEAANAESTHITDPADERKISPELGGNPVSEMEDPRSLADKSTSELPGEEITPGWKNGRLDGRSELASP